MFGEVTVPSWLSVFRDVPHPGRGAEGPGHWSVTSVQGLLPGPRCSAADVVHVVQWSSVPHGSWGA